MWKQQKWPAKVRVFHCAGIELSWAILFTCVMCWYVNSRLAETECVGEGVGGVGDQIEVEWCTLEV